jgi:hypothetical protein
MPILGDTGVSQYDLDLRKAIGSAGSLKNTKLSQALAAPLTPRSMHFMELIMAVVK